MIKIENIIKVSITYDELMKCHCVNTNRCGCLEKEEALRIGFSDADWNKFINRAEKLKRAIEKKGFSKASFFVLAKDYGNNLYLLDGQGRRKAIHLMHINDGVDFSQLEFVCDLYEKPMSLDEMTNLIIDMNTCNTNWQTKDIRRSNVMSSDDEEVKKAYEYTKRLMDEFGLTDYVANLLTFGEKASHIRNGVSAPLSTSNYARSKDVFTEAYLKFITKASYKKDKDGNDVERPKAVQKAIRNTNFAISLYSNMRNIANAHDKDPDAAKEDIMYLIDRLVDACSGDDDYVKQFVKCSGSNKEIVANKIKSYCRKKSVRDILYKLAA